MADSGLRISWLVYKSAYALFHKGSSLRSHVDKGFLDFQSVLSSFTIGRLLTLCLFASNTSDSRCSIKASAHFWWLEPSQYVACESHTVQNLPDIGTTRPHTNERVVIHSLGECRAQDPAGSDYLLAIHSVLHDPGGLELGFKDLMGPLFEHTAPCFLDVWSAGIGHGVHPSGCGGCSVVFLGLFVPSSVCKDDLILAVHDPPIAYQSVSLSLTGSIYLRHVHCNISHFGEPAKAVLGLSLTLGR